MSARSKGKEITGGAGGSAEDQGARLMQALKQSLEKAPAEEKEKPAKRRRVAGKR